MSLLLMIYAVLIVVDILLVSYGAFKGPFPIQVPLGSPLAYRNIYIHVPIAVASYAAFTMAAALGIVYLRRRSERLFKLMEAYIFLGVVLAAGTLATGIAWASESWGAPWSWDPKQTAVLLLLLAYLAYYPLKRSIADPERARRVGAAYSTAAYVMVPIAFLSSRVVESLHPSGEQARAFVEAGPGGEIFVARILLFTSIILLSGLLAVTRSRPSLPKPVPLLLILLGVALAAPLAAPWILHSGDIYRVVDADLTDNDMIASLTLNGPSGRVDMSFEEPIASPVTPAVTPEGFPSIKGHLVVIEEGVLKVVPHWSTPLSILAYLFILAAAVYVAGVKRV